MHLTTQTLYQNMIDGADTHKAHGSSQPTVDEASEKEKYVSYAAIMQNFFEAQALCVKMGAKGHGLLI